MTNQGIRILFVTKYVDHILFFFLRELARHADVLVLFEAENDWTRAFVGHRCQRRASSAALAVRPSISGGGRAPVPRVALGRHAELPRQRTARESDPVEHAKSAVGGLPRVHWPPQILGEPFAYWSVRSPSLAATAAVSGAVKDYLEGFKILRPQNVHVISHGINRAWVDEQIADPRDLRAHLGLADDAFIVLSMASLRPYKHFEVVVNAAKLLEGYPIHFVHAGNAKQWVDKASGNIHFLGHQSKPFPILAATDVFASTSHNEAFGRANLEAMACGKPLIGSRTGGLLDLIEDGVNGRFFESCDARDFADKVLFYYRDREALKAHGAAATRARRRAVRDRGDGAAIRRPLSVGALSSAPADLVGKTARHALAEPPDEAAAR